MKNIVFAYYNLNSKFVTGIVKALKTNLIEYDIRVVPNVLFCDINESLDEQFLEYLFNNHVIILRISDYSNNPFVFSVNDNIVDTYEYDKFGKIYIECKKNNMDLFKTKIEKLIELNVTPSFRDIPNSIDLVKYSDYFTRMVDFVEYLDMSEVGHSIRVAQYSKMLAKAINYDNPSLLYTAGVLHDIGKSLVPEDIKFARRKLTKEEFKEIERHPIYSYNLLNKDLYDDVRNIILYHHERCNGSGYPHGIKNISLETKILSIADSYDAMTSSRIYDNHKTKEEAICELIKCANNDIFDKYLIRKFIEILVNN